MQPSSITGEKILLIQEKGTALPVIDGETLNILTVDKLFLP